MTTDNFVLHLNFIAAIFQLAKLALLKTEVGSSVYYSVGGEAGQWVTWATWQVKVSEVSKTVKYAIWQHVGMALLEF